MSEGGGGATPPPVLRFLNYQLLETKTTRKNLNLGHFDGPTILPDMSAQAPVEQEPEDPAEAVQATNNHVHLHVVSVVKPNIVHTVDIRVSEPEPPGAGVFG